MNWLRAFLDALDAILWSIVKGETPQNAPDSPMTPKSVNVPTPTPKTPPEAVLPPKSRIPTWALAIQHAEGGKPQDLNIRNHNPGNLKYTSYTASLGAKLGGNATDGGSFCYFDSYAAGYKALCTFLTDACKGRLKAYKPTMTLDQFTEIYAQPPSKGYVNSVAQYLGVSPEIMIQELL